MATYNQLTNACSGNASNLPPEGQNALRAVGVSNPNDVIAWWKIPEDVQSEMYKRGMCLMCLVNVCSCMLFLPCTCCVHCALKSGLSSQLVILTRQKLIKQAEVETCCSKSGLDVKAYALKDIISVTSDRKGSGCCSCFPYAQTKITLPGFTGSSKRIQQNMMHIPCREDEVDQITRMISEAKENAQLIPMSAYQAVGAGPGYSGELERLTALWKQGALSDAEFQQAKKQLMSGPL